MSLVVAGVLAESFIGGWRAQLSQEIYGELQRQSRFSLDEMTKEFWNATTVTSSVVIGGTTYTSDADTIVLRLPPLDSSDTILAGDDFMVFNQNGTETERLISPDASSVRAGLKTPLGLNHDTNILEFRYFDAAGTELVPGVNNLTTARKIITTVQSSRVNAGRTFQRELKSTVILRNKGV